MILCRTHIAGEAVLPQACAECGSIVARADQRKPFRPGARVGVIITTASQGFVSYLAGDHDTNPLCQEKKR